MDISRSEAAPPRVLPLSQRLAQIAAEHGPDRLAFSALAAQLHSRAWGGLLVLFGAIGLLPLPPLTSIVFALPMLLVSAQMAIGRATPWFPNRLERRGVTKAELARLIRKMEWIEARIERVFRPRLSILTGPVATRVIGGLCFILALLAAIPIPMFHFAPAAAVVLFGLALMYRDGILVLAALAAAAAGILVSVLILGSGIFALTRAAAWLQL